MRIFNRLLALLLAIVLIGGGLFVAANVVVAGIGHRNLIVSLDRWIGTMRTTQLNDRIPLYVFIGLAVVGLVLFLAEVWRWRRRRLPIERPPGESWWLLRKPAERQLRRVLLEETPSEQAQVRMDWRQGAWTTTVRARAPQEFEPVMRERVGTFLKEAGAPDNVRTRLRVASPKRRVT